MARPLCLLPANQPVELVRASRLHKCFYLPPLVARGQLDTLNMDFNKLNKDIGKLRKVRMQDRRRVLRSASS